MKTKPCIKCGNTLADATRAAAGRIEEIGHRLLAQAERLRIDAASMEVQS